VFVFHCVCGICVGVCLFEGRNMEDDAPRKRVSMCLCVSLCMCGICVDVCLFEGRSMEDDAPRKRVSVCYVFHCVCVVFAWMCACLRVAVWRMTHHARG